MSLVSDALKMFKEMWKFQYKEHSVSEAHAHRILKGIQFFLDLLIRESEKLLKTHMGKSRAVRQKGIKEFKDILTLVNQTLAHTTYFELMQSLFIFLELYEGQVAYGKGPEAYKKFQKKWNDEKYDMLKLRLIRVA
jgi:hypothetical protein